MSHRVPELEVRQTTSDDIDDIVALAQRSLGWDGDERDREYFRWKHHENPFGRSPGWAAFDRGRLVAFRTMLRWRFESAHREVVTARAVDTATDPEHQGRGLFRRLTMEAVGHLEGEGVAAIFNTPNEQSRPGYLKMGWSDLGRPTLLVQPSSPATLNRMLHARVAAEKWSLPVDVGQSAADVVDLPPVPATFQRWVTKRSTEYLRWRYGFEPLHYRAIEVAGGACIFRVRRRGGLREVALCEWLSDRADPLAIRRLVRAVGDYAVGIGLSIRNGLVPLPRQGPNMMWRPLADRRAVALADLHLSLGDLELM